MGEVGVVVDITEAQRARRSASIRTMRDTSTRTRRSVASQTRVEQHLIRRILSVDIMEDTKAEKKVSHGTEEKVLEGPSKLAVALTMMLALIAALVTISAVVFTKLYKKY